MKSQSAGRKLPGIYARGGIFWFTYRLGGKKHFHSLGTGDYGEAVKKALEIRQKPELNPGQAFEREIDAFVAHKVASNEFSKHSAAVKPYALREFARACGKANPASVTTTDVMAFYKRLQARVQESTARSSLITLRSFFNWLMADGKMRQNPVNGVRLARVDEKGRQRFCTTEQRDRMIAEAPSDELRFILYCGFHAGMRKNEIAEARPEWFDLERGLVTIRATPTFRPKDRQERTVPLTRAFRAFLKEYGLPSPFMLRPEAKPNKSLYRVDFEQAFRRHAHKLDMPWLTLHVMRHTFASLLASAGVSIYKIAVWMGDDVAVVQKHYAKLSPDDGDIEKAFAPGESAR
jgi:integrase